ncbi:carbamate kinase [Candidatus Saccharibacteria bacterium RAAC3_TM7_1]|nr:carbamate kinase [Candidatus Saccharibacteria bacterium RAAC3_TM7_1]HCZ28735.1 carbamate kinase [Candidatus Saccharibacteria bacterium]
MPLTTVIALGGNALQQKGEASADAQKRVARLTVTQLVPLLQAGHRLVIVHGNGPQIGNIVLHEEAINTEEVPTLPLDSGVAMSQGLIGYWLQQALMSELKRVGMAVPVVTTVTQIVVDAHDPAFNDPTKPIGPFYATEAEAKTHTGAVKEDAGRGWRRVVPSPTPQHILEVETVKRLMQAGVVVIAAGGGGIPVVETESGYSGVEAVIDKDFSAAVLADAIQADRLLILTSVDAAMRSYGTSEQAAIGDSSIAEMEQYITEGHFKAGSMLPKVQASIQFAQKDPNRQAIITSLQGVGDALDGKTGTVIHQ